MSPASPVRAIGLMIAATGLLVVGDVITKHLAESYPIGQIICLRQAASLLVILPWAAKVAGWSALRVAHRSGQCGRGLLAVAGTVLVVLSLRELPIALVTAIVFSSPLFIALFSAPLLGERVAAGRWAAIAAGFAGVLIIVRPGGAAFEWALLLPVGAAITNGLRDVVTRRLSRRETSISILFWSTIIIVAAGLLTLPFGWQPVDARAAMWFLGAGVIAAGAQFTMIEALRLGHAAMVAPFRYSALLWAIVFGFAIWGELPDGATLAGAAVLIGSGVQMMRQR